MKFKVDENLPSQASEILRRDHDVATVREQGLGGASDADVFRVCANEERALITLDVDFADMRTYPPEPMAGIIVLRLGRQDKQTVVQVITRVAVLLQSEPLKGLLWIVEEDKVRIRPRATRL
jgi:predicted nuclease of predicted toxin-antitoxin system